MIKGDRRDTKVIVGTAERVAPEMTTPDAKVPELIISGVSSPALIELSTNNPEAQITDTNNPEARVLINTYHPWFETLYTTHRATLIAQASTILYNCSSNNSRLDGVAAEDMMHQAFALAIVHMYLRGVQANLRRDHREPVS